jgi:hypothetical protein
MRERKGRRERERENTQREKERKYINRVRNLLEKRK